MKIKRPAILVFSILISQAAGLIGTVFTVPALEIWYPALQKPIFNPPPSVFAPAWTILYTLMGIALYRIWVYCKSPAKNKLIVLFFIQLGFNLLWTILFFGLRTPILALFEIITLMGIVGYLTYQFGKLDKWAGILLIPYLLWGIFAAILNLAIVILN